MQRAENIRRKRRSDGGVLTGLCAGIAAHLGVDPVLVRIVLTLLTLLHYAGLAVILVYFLFSLYVPYAEESES